MPSPLGLSPATISIIVVAPLILWRIYRRFKRLVGRQSSKLWRHWSGAIFFPLLVVMLAIPAIFHTMAIAALAVGVVAGLVLAVFGLRHTRFEATPEGFFYTPNAHIGIALSLLMLARIGYRFFQIASFTPAERAVHMQDFARSPLTLLIVGMVAAYYAAYAVGMIRWRSRTMVASQPEGEAP
ncbi:MAG: hypothetical protein ACXWG1_05395 [Usitatibacter sp.]